MTTFSKSLEGAIGRCYKHARELRQEVMTVESLLLFLLEDDEVATAIVSLNGDMAKLKFELIRVVAETVKILPVDDGSDTQPSLGFQRTLQRAVYHAQSSGRDEVTPMGTLIAMYGEKDSYAVGILQGQDITRLDIVNYYVHDVRKELPPSSIETIERIRDTPRVQDEKLPEEPIKIFISYAHSDADCLERLLVHLKPLVRKSKIECWSDKKIRPGGKWREEIAQGIDSAAVAVLLLSADFLASDFIVEHELPPLLSKAEASGARIIPVVLKPCGFTRDESLQSFQSMNDPARPLLGLSHIEQEHLYDRIASEINEEIVHRERKRSS